MEEKPLFMTLVEPKDVVDYLDKQLTITPSSKQSTVIIIKVKDPVPERGKLIVKELIKQYGLSSINDKNALAVSTLKSIDQRLAIMKRDLDSVDRAIQEYRTSNNIVDIGAQGQQFLSSVGSSDQKVSEIDVQLSVLREVENYVRAKGSGLGMVPSTAGLDPMLGTLVAQLNKAESDYEKLLNTTGENNPIAVAQREEIERIRPKILDIIMSQKRNLQASRNNLSASTGRYSSMLRSMPEKERQLVEISREKIYKSYRLPGTPAKEGRN